jgi:hypothetical protein
VGWLPQGVIASGVGANRSSVHFADINGDGRAEYLWVHDDGSVDLAQRGRTRQESERWQGHLDTTGKDCDWDWQRRRWGSIC